MTFPPQNVGGSSSAWPAVPVKDNQSRRNWVPKIDFPKFDGFDVRIWLDKCKAFSSCIKFLKGLRLLVLLTKKSGRNNQAGQAHT